MISIQQIRIYQRFGGDADGLALIGTKDEKRAINGNDWALITDMVQDISLVNEGLASANYKAKLLKKLKSNCGDDEVITQLYQMAEKQIRAQTEPRPQKVGIWKSILSIFQKR